MLTPRLIWTTILPQMADVKFNELNIPTTIDLLKKDTPKIPFVVEPWLIKNTYSLLSAQPGRMKSYFALWLSGEWVKKGGSVLYLDRENSENTILPRMKQLKLPSSDQFWYWADWPSSKSTPPTTISDPILAQAVKSMKNPLVIFDNLDKFHQALDENNNSQMKTIGINMKRLKDSGCTILALHQNTKSDPKTGISRYRGASQIVADTELSYDLFTLKNVGGTMANPQNLIGISCHKTRYTGIFKRYMVFDPQKGKFVILDGAYDSNARQLAMDYFDRESILQTLGEKIQRILIAEGELSGNDIYNHINLGLEVGDSNRLSKATIIDCLTSGLNRLWGIKMDGKWKKYHVV